MKTRNWTKSTLLGLTAALVAACNTSPDAGEVAGEPVGQAEGSIQITQLGDLSVECGKATALFEILTNKEVIDYISVDAEEVLDSKMQIALFAVDEQGNKIHIATETLHSMNVSQNSHDLDTHDSLATSDSTYDRHESMSESGSSLSAFDADRSRSRWNRSDTASSQAQESDSLDVVDQSADSRSSSSASQSAAQSASSAERVRAMGLGLGWDWGSGLDRSSYSASRRQAAASRSAADADQSSAQSSDNYGRSSDSASSRSSMSGSNASALDLDESVSSLERSDFAKDAELDVERTNSTLVRDSSLSDSSDSYDASQTDQSASVQDQESFMSSSASFEQLDTQSIKKFLVAVSFESAVEELESTEATSTGNISIAAGLGDLILADAVFGTMLGGCN